VTFKCKKYLRNNLFEQFGTEIKIEETDDDMLLVRLKASENAMYHWGLQYLDGVEMLSPERLREKLKDAVKDAYRKYCCDSEKGGDNS
ncbi:MAG: WYL domain-containing protein, partial [Oscillospiraceae bacterium]|nr:WYL domain-containing protein [Oscillospiraceae bacterium]